MEPALIDTYVPASNSQKNLSNCMNKGCGLRFSSTCTMWRKNLKSYFNNFTIFEKARILTNTTLYYVLKNRVCRIAIITEFCSIYNEVDSCLIFIKTDSKLGSNLILACHISHLFCTTCCATIYLNTNSKFVATL